MHPTPFTALAAVLLLFASSLVHAVDYEIDTRGAHAFIEFRIKHLGYSWLLGRFNRFRGDFSYDPKHPESNRVKVTIDLASLDSNHAERDRHLRSARFFDVKEFPQAVFVSTGWEPLGDGRAKLTGKLTLRGITRPVTIDVSEVGHGPDPWGGYRRGFEGTTTLKLSDWKMKEAAILGPAAEEIIVYLSVEGIRK